MDENNIDPELLRQINEALSTLGSVSSNLSENLSKNSTIAETVSKTFTSLNNEINKLQALTKNYQNASEKTIKATNATSETYATAASNVDASFVTLINSTFKLQGAFDGLTKTINSLNGNISGFGPPSPPDNNINNGGFDNSNPIVKALHDLLGENSKHLNRLNDIGNTLTNISDNFKEFNTKLTNSLFANATVQLTNQSQPAQNTPEDQFRAKIQEEYLAVEGLIRDSKGQLVDIEEIKQQEIQLLKKQIEEREKIFPKQQKIFSQEELQEKLRLEQESLFNKQLKQIQKQIQETIVLNKEDYAKLREANAELIKKQQEQTRLMDPDKYFNELKERAKNAPLTTIFPGLEKFKEVFDLFKSALKGAVDAVVSFTKSLLDGERGQEMAAKAVTKFTTALTEPLDNLSTALTGVSAALVLLMRTPVGLALSALAAGVALVTKAVSGSIKVFNELNERAAKLNDQLFKGFTDLAESSMSSSQGMTGLFKQIQKLELQGVEIGKFTDLVKNSGKNLQMFGLTAATGLDRFVDVSSKLLKSELGITLENMGITADLQRSHVLEFLSQEARLRKLQGRTNEELGQAAGKYIKELDTLAALTGATRKEQEDARASIMAIEELRAARMTATDQKEIEKLDRAIKAAENMYAAGAKDIAMGIARYFAAGGVVDEYSARAIQAIPKMLDSIDKGTGNAVDNFKLGVTELYEQAKKMAAAGRFDAGLLRSLTGESFATIDELQLRLEALLKAEADALANNQKFDIKKFLEESRKPQDKQTQDYINTFIRGTRQLATNFESQIKRFGESVKVNKWVAENFKKGVEAFEKVLQKYLGPVEQPVPVPNYAPPLSPEWGISLDTDTSAEDELRIQEAKRNKYWDKYWKNQKEIEKLTEKNNQLKEEEQKRIIYLEEAKTKQNKWEIARIENHLKIIRSAIKANEETLAKSQDVKKEMDNARPNSRGTARRYPSAADVARAEGQTAGPSPRDDPLAGLNFGGKREERTGGGKVDPKLIELARKIHETYPGSIFTAMNDLYHQEKYPDSKHTEGKALDFKFSPDLAPKNAQEAQVLLSEIRNLGAASVRDEYFKDVNSRTKGQHFHVEIAHNGGYFRAPSGKEFPVLLKSNELVLTENMVKNIQSQLNQVQKDSVGSVLPEALKTTNPVNSDILVEKITKAVVESTNNPLTGTLLDTNNNLSDKLLEYMSRQENLIESLNNAIQNMVNTLEESRDIQDDLLKHSRI